MTTQRQERIYELSRSEYRRRRVPSFLSQVSEAIGAEVSENHLVPFDLSEEIRQSVYSRIKEILGALPGNEHLLLPPTSRLIFDDERLRRARFLGSESVVLSLGRFSDLPLLQVRPSDIEDRFYDLWRLGDTVTMCSPDVTKGLMADWYPDDPEQAFEIASWGID